VPEEAAWSTLWSIKDTLNQKLEPMRAAKEIGTGLDTRIGLSLNPELKPLLASLGESLEDLMVVSSVEIQSNGGSPLAAEGFEVTVEAHTGTKCPRCWNRRGGAGEGDDADLCPRCWEVVKAGVEA
jgi:isoleucyl-tRNA synthetase